MKLSPKAKEGLEYAIKCLEKYPNKAGTMRALGIDNMVDTWSLMEYLRETGREKMIKEITAQQW